MWFYAILTPFRCHFRQNPFLKIPFSIPKKSDFHYGAQYDRSLFSMELSSEMVVLHTYGFTKYFIHNFRRQKHDFYQKNCTFLRQKWKFERKAGLTP